VLRPFAVRMSSMALRNAVDDARLEVMSFLMRE
jgi:hypothetical protein